MPDVVRGADVAKTILDIDRGRDGHFVFVDDYNTGYLTGSGDYKNKTVIVSRFSSPGSFESMTPAFKDFRSGDFSVYNSINNRNLTTRRPFQGVTSSIVPETQGVRNYDHTGRAFGFTNLAARHATRFFRDSTLVEDKDHSNVPRNFVNTSSGPGNADDAFTEAASFHKVHRNNLLKAREVERTTSITYQNENSLRFTDTTDAKSLSTRNFDLTSREMTFSFWIYDDKTTNLVKHIFSLNVPTGSLDNQFSPLQISLTNNNPDSQIAFALSNADESSKSADVRYLSVNTVTRDQWNHIFIRWDGDSSNKPEIWINNTASNSTPSGFLATPINISYSSNHRHAIGRGTVWNPGTNNQGRDYLIDEFGFWNGQLSDADKDSLYNSGSYYDIDRDPDSVKSSDMYFYLRMGDSTGDASVGNLSNGDVVVDAGGNNDFEASVTTAGQLQITASTFDVFSETVISTFTEIVCDQKYDNLNLHHQIPRSDRQYSWIGASITHTKECEPRYSGFMQTDSPLAPYYEITGNYYPFFDYVSASVATSGIYQNTTRLDLLVHDETGSETNTLGTSTIAGALQTPAEGERLNALLTHRGDTYGWNWRAFHQQDHPILDREHKENLLTALKNEEIREFRLPPVSMKGRPVMVNVNTSGRNLTLKATHNNEKVYFNQRELNDLVFQTQDPTTTPFDQLVSVAQDNGLNWVRYSESLFPSTVNEFSRTSRERVGYDNEFWRDDRSERTELGSTDAGNGLGYNSFAIEVSQSSWVLDAPENFLTRTELLTGNISAPSPFFQHYPYLSGTAGELQNEYLYSSVTTSLGIASGLDAFKTVLYKASSMLYRRQTLTSPNSVVSRTGFAKTGSLDDTFSHQIPNFAGEALWEAGTYATINTKSGSSFVTSSYSSEPWFDEYGDFREELQLVARDYAVIPEFRISEHIEEYTKGGTFNKSNFDTFEIPGTNASSSQKGFYKDYSNSDFLREFASIKDKSGLDAKEIMLTCKAAVRFNPYKGFYPAQRAVELASQFSSSYSSGFKFIYSGSTGATTSGGFLKSGAGAYRPLIQTLFAPGILYNSIKSGIAVDYPIVNNDVKIEKFNYNNSVASTENYMIGGRVPVTKNDLNDWDPSTQVYWDLRVPFETMVEPEKYIDKVQFLDFEPHPSSSLNATASVDTSVSDGVYELMAKNFFGQTGDFFLKNSSYTKIESDLIQDGLKFKQGDVFAARLKIRKSHNGNRFYDDEYDSRGITGTSSYFAANGAKAFNDSFPTSGTPPTELSGSYPLPQDPAHKTDFQETFTMYSRPTAFGPAISGRSNTNAYDYEEMFLSGTLDSLEGYNWAYTPPYYHGESWVDFIFRPDSEKTYTLEDILTEVETVYWRVDPGPMSGSAGGSLLDEARSRTLIHGQFDPKTPGDSLPIYGGSVVNKNAMQLDSSLNLFGVERVPKRRKDKFGNTILDQNELAGKRWVIQPKWETPMLNFANVSEDNNNITYPTNFSESVPRGIWHQFGEIPTDPGTGVFLEIGDIPNDWLRHHYEVINEESVYNNGYPSQSGSTAYLDYQSLTDLFGFSRSQKKDSAKVRLGEIADKREVYEAVVAIPYIVEASEDYIGDNKRDVIDRKKFIDIPRPRFKAALKEREGSKDGDSLSIAGESIREMVQKMKRYVLPPQFDFINFDEIDPIVMYFFEFKYEFDKDDLSYIWQNLAPRDYKKITFQEASVAHDLMNTELLEEQNIIDNPNLRWMVFKVKQKATKDYYDLVPPQIKAARPTVSLDKPETDKDDEYLQFNWPYDYLSFVELVKLDADVLYKEEEEESPEEDDE